MVANNGYFKGTIEGTTIKSSIIETAWIKGVGDLDYALKITDTNYGFIFGRENEE
jgi:hypothetical protein